MEDEVKIQWPQDASPLPDNKVNRDLPVMSADPADQNKMVSVSVGQLADQAAQSAAINGQRLQAQAPGALTAGPAGQPRYMHLRGPATGTSTWTFNGTTVITLASNEEGDIWWNGTTWALDSKQALPQVDTSGLMEKDGYDGTGSDLNFRIQQNKNDFDRIATKTEVENKQLFDNSTMLPNAWQGDGSVNTSVNWIRTPKIPIPADQNTISFSGAGTVPSTSARYIFFNEAGGVISTVSSASNQATSGTAAKPNGATHFALNAANFTNAANNPTGSPYAETFMVNFGAQMPYQEYGADLSTINVNFQSIDDWENIVTKDEFDADQVVGQLEANTSDIEDINSVLYSEETRVIGVQNPGVGNGNTSTNRTRIDNSFPITSLDGSPVPITNLAQYINAAGPGKIKFLQKVLDGSGNWVAGKYTVYAEFNVTFALGDNFFGTEVFGANFKIPSGSWYAVYGPSPTAASVALGVQGASYQFTGGDLVATSTASETSGILQFKINVTDKVSVLPGLEQSVEQIENSGVVLPDLMYSFTLSSYSLFVYTKLKGNKYAKHLIKRTIDNSDAVYVDYYRYQGCVLSTLVNGVFNDGLTMVTPQESEFVYQQVGKIDFAGGFHGDEKINTAAGKGVTFFVDGQALDVTANIALTQGKEFYYIEHSMIYEAPAGTTENPIPNTAHPAQAEHIKITSLKNNRFKTKNLCKWLVQISLSQYYSGILCTSINLAERAYNGKDYIDYDLSAGGTSSNNNQPISGQGISEATSRNATTGLGLHVKSSILNGGGVISDATKWYSKRNNNNLGQYWKDYFGLRTSYISGAAAEIITTVVGDTWISETEVEFFVK